MAKTGIAKLREIAVEAFGSGVEVSWTGKS
jgi:hypothetical protein